MDWRKIWKNITVEPILFFFSVSQGLYVIVAQSLYIQKVCQVNLNITEDICLNITNHKVEQLEVQKYVSVLQGYNGVLQAIPAIVYALFAGPWSDENGRKLLIVFSCFGYIFNNGVFIINTIWFKELKAEFLLFECLQDMTGGYVCFFLACYAYISDISTKEKRTKRLAFLDGLFPAGFFTGMALSGPIKDRIGFIGNFSLSIVFALSAMFWAIFILKDSRKQRPKEVQAYLDIVKKMENPDGQITAKKGKCLTLFDVENVKKGFTTVFKKRENNLRTYIVLLVIVFVLECFLINGKGPTQYLYFRRKFSWDMNKFGMYIGLFGFVGMFAQFVAVPFLTEKVKLHDTTIGVIAIASCIVQAIMVCFIPSGEEYEWLIYLAGVISFLGVSITTTTRSLVTKCVGPLEVGKVFSIMGAFQASVPLVGSPTYAYIYKGTIETFPGAFLLFSASVYLVVLALLVGVNLGMRKSGVFKRETKSDFQPIHMEGLLQKKDEDTKFSVILIV
ncbi:proton-coupled folate transporter isoform X2 [Eurytemora carolleeae]|uniref:proton-coupled folate transporter isoform X2 n=1 Tax=Eurytemora carolleeae TaxID=1294199 RepID=UPI000C776F6A|nr:proton-coupled folate transporter isoform X2 [Eurytemora carolleeae]|eukprot:XP_023336366.1 proton-coupled folate transporter-like isoform X2 [Eurytemora affinis]